MFPSPSETYRDDFRTGTSVYKTGDRVTTPVVDVNVAPASEAEAMSNEDFNHLDVDVSSRKLDLLGSNLEWTRERLMDFLATKEGFESVCGLLSDCSQLPIEKRATVDRIKQLAVRNYSTASQQESLLFNQIEQNVRYLCV